MQKIHVVLLIVLPIVALGLVAGPILLGNPMGQQSETDLAVSYLLSRWSPILTIALLALGAFAYYRFWKGSRSWLGRSLLAVPLLLLAAASWVAQQQIVEWIFTPIAEVGFAAVSAAEISDAEMVLGVEISDQAKAYPVGLLGYHHLVNDELAGVALVATY